MHNSQMDDKQFG